MTVPVPSQLVYTYVEDGVTTVFPYPVRFLEPQELRVVREVDGVETILGYNVDYTVSGAGNPSGGSITRTAATTGGKLIISRDTGWKQLVDLKDSARNPAEAVEQQLDRLAMAGQDVGRRALALEEGSGSLLAASKRAVDAAAEAQHSAASAKTDADRAETARDIAGGYASDAISQGNVPIYATVVGMPALEVPIGINAIRVNGESVAGDGGGGLYVDADNGSDNTFTSGDGRTWYRVEDVSSERMTNDLIAQIGFDHLEALLASSRQLPVGSIVQVRSDQCSYQVLDGASASYTHVTVGGMKLAPLDPTPRSMWKVPYMSSVLSDQPFNKMHSFMLDRGGGKTTFIWPSRDTHLWDAGAVLMGGDSYDDGETLFNIRRIYAPGGGYTPDIAVGGVFGGRAVLLTIARDVSSGSAVYGQPRLVRSSSPDSADWTGAALALDPDLPANFGAIWHQGILPWPAAEGGADGADPPPLNGSTLKYGFDHEGGPRWQPSDTSPMRSSRSFGRLRFCAARAWRWRMLFARSAFPS